MNNEHERPKIKLVFEAFVKVCELGIFGWRDVYYLVIALVPWASFNVSNCWG